MANGSLDAHLYRTNDNGPLLRKKILDICIGAARGLQHLHVGVEQGIIHRDIKPVNILLDKNWVAKLSDFTFCKLIPNDDASEAILDSGICGTPGYMAPEYIMHGTLSKKAVVYSFGVVLLVVLCSKKLHFHGHKATLVHWFKSSVKNGTIDQVIDPYLIGNVRIALA
ncbi:putative receptor-like protein kinase At5g39000 [Camellia sinensis]|uniref:putative receptor-like protein kinase At5g39000 n=1 Tax=Camellia sinensis TaxID=4442 RepID=UPI001035D1A8|nr:putative receptor-like protein kinase At5g39000 [Camellia sinensis]